MPAWVSAIDLTPWQVALAAIALFGAGFVRGFSGFGFSMVAVTGLSLLRPPAEIIPVVMLLEVLASLHMLKATWRDADWHSLRWLLPGMVAATPLGVAILAVLPPDPMRVIVSCLVLLAAAGLMTGWRRHGPIGQPAILAVGALAGFLNGAASIAGPPIIVFYLSSPSAMNTSRASMIAFFLMADLVALLSGGALGLVDRATWYRVGVFIVPVVAGLTLGQRHFVRTPPEEFRRLVLILLIVLSIAGLVRALF